MRRIAALLILLGMTFAGHLRAQTCTNHQIDLSWTYTQGSDPATGFLVFSEEQGQGTFTKLTATPLAVAQLAYTDCAAQGGATDSYYVVAVDAAGNQSAPSNIWASPVVPVDAVNGVQAVHNSNGSNTVTWGSSPDAGLYSITRSLAACGTAGAAFSAVAAGLSGTSWSDASPPVSSNYCYGVTTVVNGNSSPAVFGGVSVPPNAATLTGRIVK